MQHETRAERNARMAIRAEKQQMHAVPYKHDAHFAPDGGYLVHKHEAKPRAAWAVMGLEVETDTRTGSERAMLASVGNPYTFGAFPCEDGSLSFDGIEWKTDAGTLPYLFRLVGALYERMDAHGYTARYDGRSWQCGLHVHIANETFGVTDFARDNAAYKMSVAIYRFTPFFAGIAGRDFRHWANPEIIDRVERVMYRDVNDLPVRTAQAEMKALCATKYAAVNICHEGTIELRIGAGRETAQEVEQYLVRVNALVNLAKDKHLSCEWFETCSADEFEAAFYEKEFELLGMLAELGL